MSSQLCLIWTYNDFVWIDWRLSWLDGVTDFPVHSHMRGWMNWWMNFRNERVSSSDRCICTLRAVEQEFNDVQKWANEHWQIEVRKIIASFLSQPDMTFRWKTGLRPRVVRILNVALYKETITSAWRSTSQNARCDVPAFSVSVDRL